MKFTHSSIIVLPWCNPLLMQHPDTHLQPWQSSSPAGFTAGAWFAHHPSTQTVSHASSTYSQVRPASADSCVEEAVRSPVSRNPPMSPGGGVGPAPLLAIWEIDLLVVRRYPVSLPPSRFIESLRYPRTPVFLKVADAAGPAFLKDTQIVFTSGKRRNKNRTADP